MRKSDMVWSLTHRATLAPSVRKYRRADNLVWYVLPICLSRSSCLRLPRTCRRRLRYVMATGGGKTRHSDEGERGRQRDSIERQIEVISTTKISPILFMVRGPSGGHVFKLSVRIR
jgi:hypothetical protein